MIRRAVTMMALALGIVLLGASSAMARGGGWEPLPADPFTFPTEICGFPVDVTPTVNQEYVKTLSETPTTVVQRVTGNFVNWLTNTDTGASITVNSSGPGTFTIQLDTGILHIVGEGRWLLAFFPADQQEFGVSGLTLFTSRFSEDLDLATGDVSNLQSTGHARDLCAALS